MSVHWSMLVVSHSEKSTLFHRWICFCILLNRFWSLITWSLVWFSSVNLMSLVWLLWSAEAMESCTVLGFLGGWANPRLWGNLRLEALRWERRWNNVYFLSQSHSYSVRAMVSEPGLPGSVSCLCHLLVGWTWASYFASLCFHFLIWKWEQHN